MGQARRGKGSAVMPRATRSRRDQDVHVFFENSLADPPEWRVRYRGADVAAADQQWIAIAAAQAVARRHRCDLVVHGRDGRIRRKDSYGEDSPRRKG